MLVSTKFSKRSYYKNLVAASITTSCTRLPFGAEHPIHLLLNVDDDNNDDRLHFQLNMTIAEAQSLSASLTKYIHSIKDDTEKVKNGEAIKL